MYTQNNSIFNMLPSKFWKKKKNENEEEEEAEEEEEIPSSVQGKRQL